MQDIYQACRYLNVVEGYYRLGYKGASAIPEENGESLPVNEFSPDRLDNIRILCWGISAQALGLQNTLKAKPWRNKFTPINLPNYIERLLLTTVATFRFFDYIGLTEAHLIQSFKRKNRIVLERIKNPNY